MRALFNLSAILLGLGLGVLLALAMDRKAQAKARAQRKAQEALARLAFLDQVQGRGTQAQGPGLAKPRAGRAPFAPFDGSGPRKPW
jgi:hypothetical protein